MESNTALSINLIITKMVYVMPLSIFVGELDAPNVVVVELDADFMNLVRERFVLEVGQIIETLMISCTIGNAYQNFLWYVHSIS